MNEFWSEGDYSGLENAQAGEAIVTIVRFADSVNPKIWPALLLFEELGNMVKAGISINLRMKGIPITKAEGAAQD